MYCWRKMFQSRSFRMWTQGNDSHLSLENPPSAIIQVPRGVGLSVKTIALAFDRKIVSLPTRRGGQSIRVSPTETFIFLTDDCPEFIDPHFEVHCSPFPSPIYNSHALVPSTIVDKRKGEKKQQVLFLHLQPPKDALRISKVYKPIEVPEGPGVSPCP